jgi:pyruvate kinase
VGVQKHIIKRARELNRCVITATQMMESMILNPLPSRAEVFDVANAVLDGTDAVMLSAETAAGEYPIEAVQAMSRVCIGAEKQLAATKANHRLDLEFCRTDEAIAMATMYVANHLQGIKAIICMTESGYTALWMSRIRSGIPIYAFSHQPKTLRRVLLYRGVEPIFFDAAKVGSHLDSLAIAELKRKNLVQQGDQVLLTKGDRMGIQGTTNVMKILEVL